MSTPATQVTFDRSAAEIVFPDAKGIFQAAVKPLDEIKSTCLVVLDTNVLLVPYTINSKGLDEIAKAYRKLAAEKRLVIPAQVAREFAKHRATKLTELHQQLSVKLSKVSAFQLGKYPLLETLPEFRAVVEIEAKIDSRISSYRKAISELIGRIRTWRWNDPVSELYASLFAPEIIVDPSIGKEALEADVKRRIEHKIPPGYKDASKDDLGSGDVLIWHTILECGRTQKSDVIFVSGDEKTDWFHQSDGALYPRFELVDEFRRVCGPLSFHILKLSDFLDLFGAEPEVVKEVRNEEAKLVHPTEDNRRPFDRDRALHSELAAMHWFMRTLPNFEIDSIRKDDFDLIGTQKDGRKLRIEIRSVQNSMAWMPRIVQMTEKYFECARKLDGDAVFCLVTDNEDCALQLTNQFNPRIVGASSNRVCIGWLDGDEFVEGATFCFQ